MVTCIFDVFQLTNEQDCEDGVFTLATNYFDRFLTCARISKTQLQLLGATCLLISSKLKQTFPLSPEHLVAYTQNSITVDELLVSQKTSLYLSKRPPFGS